ncbi:hypothetical protein [Flavobacterium alkalisoli]|uniref:hypothetical protein n=1 Tax=Flavobacterium alkalisoli TaxID=2602769 RepID=UPI003A8EE491
MSEYFKDLVNHIVKSTQHIVMLNPATLMPEKIGSGCLIIYRNKLFFISVQHVTEVEGLQAVMDTGKVGKDGTTVYSLPVLNYVKELDLEKYVLQEDLYAQLKPLDICYAEIKGDLETLQEEMTIADVLVTADSKRFLITELTKRPYREGNYSFFGRIRPAGFENELIQTEKLVLGLKYDCKIGPFERFLLKDNITDHKDFKGTSGAPILSEEGEPVAFVAHGILNEPHIYAFSAVDLKKYLDLYIDSIRQ